MYLCVFCVCVWIYMYVYMYTYTHYICVCVCVERERERNMVRCAQLPELLCYKEFTFNILKCKYP